MDIIRFKLKKNIYIYRKLLQMRHQVIFKKIFENFENLNNELKTIIIIVGMYVPLLHEWQTL